MSLKHIVIFITDFYAEHCNSGHIKHRGTGNYKIFITAWKTKKVFSIFDQINYHGTKILRQTVAACI